jgi:hypothetical protein
MWCYLYAISSQVFYSFLTTGGYVMQVKIFAIYLSTHERCQLTYCECNMDDPLKMHVVILQSSAESSHLITTEVNIGRDVWTKVIEGSSFCDVIIHPMS